MWPPPEVAENGRRRRRRLAVVESATVDRGPSSRVLFLREICARCHRCGRCDRAMRCADVIRAFCVAFVALSRANDVRCVAATATHRCGRTAGELPQVGREGGNVGDAFCDA